MKNKFKRIGLLMITLTMLLTCIQVQSVQAASVYKTKAQINKDITKNKKQISSLQKKYKQENKKYKQQTKGKKVILYGNVYSTDV